MNKLPPEINQKKIGLALSGGGFRGLVHAGILQALEEFDLKPQVIAATSFGGFIGAFYAAGHRPSQILSLFESFKVWPFLGSFPNQKGLVSIKPLRRLLQKYLPSTFESLHLPLTINATNLAKGESVYFSEGELIMPLLASASVPILFKPIQLNEQYLVDGGILNNLPVEPLLQAACNFLIGCNSNHAGTKRVIHYKHIIERTFNLAINQNVEARKQHLHCLIEPPEMAQFQVFDWKKGKKMYQIGYDYTKQLLSNLR